MLACALTRGDDAAQTAAQLRSEIGELRAQLAEQRKLFEERIRQLEDKVQQLVQGQPARPEPPSTDLAAALSLARAETPDTTASAAAGAADWNR